ncbi:tetratricopeptide repeat protein [Agriterribacter sp.]|uniref:tetratricopeptide repeat protein n=1 Tax=Agriterribacter sp. TaxID=2821509 RepID=UPI002C76B575|nr:tetratricopeptide repeat protein [Agriterribacter sp.]HRP58347.1 tetratricopeptide repeat protein [Agriterribacter sp.]
MRSSIYSGLLFLLVFICSCGGSSDEDAAGLADENALHIAQLQKKVQLNPDSLGTRYQLMNALTQGGKYQEALLQNDTLMAEDTANAALWYRRGDILLQTGDSVNGIHALERAVDVTPAFAEPQLQLAAIYAGRSQSAAIQLADRIIATSQETRTTSQAYFIKGLYYSNINETDKALAQFDECLKSDYTFLDAYIEKGLLLYDRQRFSEALAVFERAIQVSNTFAEACFQAGRCEEALGNKDEAKLYYQKALGLDKDFAAAGEALERLK